MTVFPVSTDLAELLAGAGITPAGELELICDNAWSLVARVPLAGGAVAFAKRCGSACAFEPDLLRAFAVAGDEVGPPVLAERAPWVITADAGVPIREVLADAALFEKYGEAQAVHAKFQQRWTSGVDALLATGLPRHATRDLMPLLDELLDAPVARAEPAGLTSDDTAAIRAARPELTAMVAALSDLGIADTIHHDDFHMGNVLVAPDGTPAIIDWGDASVSHPFFHLSMAYAVIAGSRKIDLDHPNLDRARDDYLAAWTHVAPLDELRRYAHIAEHLGAIVRAASWSRCIADAGPDEPAPFDNPVAHWLRKLMPTTNDIAARRARAAMSTNRADA